MSREKVTKSILAGALIRLLNTKKLEDIMVNDILSASEISRTTFYRHFEDKYALANWTISQYMSELVYRYQHISCYRQLMFDITSFLFKKHNVFFKLFSYRGQNSFWDYFVEQTTDYVTTHLENIDKKTELSVEERYMVAFNSVGCIQIIYDWLARGCKETPQEISQIILDCMPEKLKAKFSPFFHETWELRDDWDLIHTPNFIETL